MKFIYALKVYNERTQDQSLPITSISLRFSVINLILVRAPCTLKKLINLI